MSLPVENSVYVTFDLLPVFSGTAAGIASNPTGIRCQRA